VTVNTEFSPSVDSTVPYSPSSRCSSEGLCTALADLEFTASPPSGTPHSPDQPSPSSLTAQSDNGTSCVFESPCPDSGSPPLHVSISQAEGDGNLGSGETTSQQMAAAVFNVASPIHSSADSSCFCLPSLQCAAHASEGGGDVAELSGSWSFDLKHGGYSDSATPSPSSVESKAMAMPSDDEHGNGCSPLRHLPDLPLFSPSSTARRSLSPLPPSAPAPGASNYTRDGVNRQERKRSDTRYRTKKQRRARHNGPSGRRH